jgi:hypothetical protein
MTHAILDRVRAICLALPEVNERPSHGMPTFFIRNRNTFANYADNHHDDGILGLWCAAPDGMQEIVIAADPKRFFRPPYVGHRGWIGVRLDRDPDWEVVAGILEDAYRTIAPKTLIAILDARLADSGD